MRFLTLLYIVSFATSTLAAGQNRGPHRSGIKPGSVVMIKPEVWQGKGKTPGGHIPHPAAVVRVHSEHSGKVAKVAELGHGPPAGHLVQTDRIMPSIGHPDHHGRQSITDLRTHEVNTGEIPGRGSGKPWHLPSKELKSLRVAVDQAKLKKQSGDQAAAIGKEKMVAQGFNDR